MKKITPNHFLFLVFLFIETTVAAQSKQTADSISYKAALKYDIFKKIKDTYTVSSFHGYACAEFSFNGRKAKIVKPGRTAKGRPFVWRARFWGVEPQTDIALLSRGFHVVYCDV
ncbi:MAG TPA: hypothetical protein VM187_01940, partial [Niastella sp.]|nr:hypothetical protein [Niastella sp.]